VVGFDEAEEYDVAAVAARSPPETVGFGSAKRFLDLRPVVAKGTG
jgi:hypothetical protein